MSLEQNQSGIARFNRWAKIYDRGHLKTWLKEAQATAVEGLDLKADDWFLDVGCGTGWAVIQAAGRLPAGMACGIDFSPAMIQRAWQNAERLSNAQFGVADAEAIPYPDGRFSAVICTNSFHHYSDPVRALSEMRRVLRPGGRVLLVDANRGGCLWVWCWDRILRVCERSHVRYYTSAEIMRLMSDAGFVRVTLVATEHGHLRYGKVAWARSVIRAERGDARGNPPKASWGPPIAEPRRPQATASVPRQEHAGQYPT